MDKKDFTIYVLKESLNLTATKLGCFFEDEYNADIQENISKIISANTSGKTWHINVESDKAKKGLAFISDEIIENVFNNMIEHDGSESKQNMLKRLLELALSNNYNYQDSAKKIYSQKHSETIKNYITQLKSSSALNKNETEMKNVVESKYDLNFYSSEEFFLYIKKNLEKIVLFQVAMQSGGEFLRPNTAQFDVLKQICNAGISIQFLINSADATKEMWKYTRVQSGIESKMYHSIEESTEIWKEYANTYENFKIKACDITLLHNYVCCHFNDYSILRVGLYHYGTNLREFPHVYYLNNQKEYEILNQEFSYLWNSDQTFEIINE